MRPLTFLFALICLFFTPLFAPDEGRAQDGANHVELIGKFSQSPQGGVTFSADQQPDVVYTPMTVSADPSDYLGIFVKITGTVTQSFVRDGKTIKMLNLAKIEPMNKEYGDTQVSQEAFYGVEGSDPVQIHKYRDHTCYLYERFAVQEQPADSSEGMNLTVVSRKPADDPIALCENVKAAPYLPIPDEGADHFYGLSGDRLFIDDGEGPSPHALIVYDLGAKKAAFTAPFFTPVVLEKGRYLEFVTLGGPLAVKKGRAKSAAAKGEKTDAGAKEKIRVDLKDFAVTSLGR